MAQTMTDCITHRGPDSAGIWQDPDLPLVLGHRRLAILDLSEEGHQPMTSAGERYMIAYNGECYNHLELRQALEEAGVKFKGRSDTETILAAIEHWGFGQTLQKLNGMFAFALWDRKDRVLHFARDRLGKKPLYIGWAGKTLVFGSELKAIHAHPDFTPEINPEGLGIYMRFGYLIAPHCIYKNIWQLPAGHHLSLDLQTLKPNAQLPDQMQPYWDHIQIMNAARANRIDKPESEVVDALEALLSDCVKSRMISDVPLGAFLSGGIDSSAVVALMQKTSSQPVKTYSIGFEEAGFNEAEHAKEIANYLGTDHHEHYLSAQDSLDIVPSLATMYDEPFADASAIPTYLVSKFAREDVTVALSGDGGDEMFGGYNRHVMAPKIWAKMRLLPRPLRKVLAASIRTVPQDRWCNILPKTRPHMGRSMHKLAEVIEQKSPPGIYDSLVTHFQTPPLANPAEMPALYHESDDGIESLSFAEKMMIWDALQYLPYDIMTKVDRASMAVSLEARAPLLDYRVFEYAWRLPIEMKIHDGKGKHILREVLARHVPRELFERPKQGFSVPIGEWLKGPLREWAEDLLEPQNMRNVPVLDTRAVYTMWQAHKAGRADYPMQLWTILMFQAWQRAWL